MATVIWEGDVSGDASNALNWAGGIPTNDDDVIIPSYATYGITAGMDAIGSVTLKSFWVQEGFDKEIGTDSGFFEIDVSGSSGNRFLYEGSSTRAKFFIKKMQTNGVIEVRRTGVGNIGQAALQIMTPDITRGGSIDIGHVSVFSGEVSLGPEDRMCEISGLTVGSSDGEGNATVYLGRSCRGTEAADFPVSITVNSGTVICDNSLVTVDQTGGVVEHRGDGITTLNLWGGVSKLNNPHGASGGRVITKLNLRGGTLDNSDNPTQKTITNADLYSGTIDDPMGKLTWSNPVVFKNAMTDVDFDFGPEKTVTIA